MTAPAPTKITVPPGMVAFTTYGQITAETFTSALELRAFCERAGLQDIAWSVVTGNLVDKTRNEAARQMLATKIKGADLGWLLYLDADMTFVPTLLDNLLATAYAQTPWADIVGGYCQLRGKPYLPTIDTGSGTWEPHDPGCGPLEVIRTGGACLLVKRHVFERMQFPWFGVRPAPRALDVLAELDNFARCKMDGRNLLRDHPAWATLERCAAEDAVAGRTPVPPRLAMTSVGEDSNFCDKARALGFRIVVQTDAVCGHLDRHLITHADHISAMHEIERNQRLAVGLENR